MHQLASEKTIRRAQHHQRTTIEPGRKVHLLRPHPHGWQGEHQTLESGCSLWPTQQECVESERYLRGNQNQGLPSCRSYHPPLWLWNGDNLSSAYKEAKPLSHDLSKEDSRHHMAKTHPRHRNLTRASVPSTYTILMLLQLRWVGHVVCMKDHRLPKKLLYGELSTAVHFRSRSLNIVSLSDMIEGSHRSWDLYTTGQLIDGLQ